MDGWKDAQGPLFLGALFGMLFLLTVLTIAEKVNKPNYCINKDVKHETT